MNKLQQFIFKTKLLFRSADEIRFNPTRLVGGTLFIIAWATGEVSGVLAWAIFLLFLDLEMKWRR